MIWFISKGPKEAQWLQLADIRKQVEHQRESLMQHLTMLDATLLGILTVFQDKLRIPLSLRSLTGIGVALLFLSLALGIYYLCMAYSQNEKSFRELVEVVRTESNVDHGSVKAPFGFLASAKLCPTSLCLGLLFLLLSLFWQ